MEEILLNIESKEIRYAHLKSGLLHDLIIERKKEGFPIPISSWFRHEMKPFVRDLLAPETLSRRGLFDPNYVAKLIEQHESRFADHGALLWGLISLELWYRTYIDSPPRKVFRSKLTVVA